MATGKISRMVVNIKVVQKLLFFLFAFLVYGCAPIEKSVNTSMPECPKVSDIFNSGYSQAQALWLCGDKSSAKKLGKKGAEAGDDQLTYFYLDILAEEGGEGFGLVYALKKAENGNLEGLQRVMRISNSYDLSSLENFIRKANWKYISSAATDKSWALMNYTEYAIARMAKGDSYSAAYVLAFVEWMRPNFDSSQQWRSTQALENKLEVMVKNSTADSDVLYRKAQILRQLKIGDFSGFM